MAKRCVRYKRTPAGRRCAKFSGTKRKGSYRGYGQSVKVYSGLGALDVNLDSLLPPAVGGGAALGTTLMLRGIIDPMVKDESGGIAYEDDQTTPKVHWAFKYAGLLGAGAGVLASAVLGFAGMGWGSTAIGAVSALTTGMSAQFYNSVVKAEVGEGADMVKRREMYAWRGYGRNPYGLVALQPRGGNGAATLMEPTGYMRGTQGYGMIGASPSQARNFLVAGRGVQSMPTDVLRQVNAAAWGGSAPVM